ncbi:hypothetical protein NPIL_651281 [Nephila pilipes]|uniref:Uncharacterized protein n=1 Tax=Nephila pilipes TaxID=299642 RepID=A0A8X6PCD0_NEPPI|nr:hypothetical protein NPIL_651281 [Nephila pilipes]
MKKRRASTPILHAGSKFRHGLLQLMIHSIDPLHDGEERSYDLEKCFVWSRICIGRGLSRVGEWGTESGEHALSFSESIIL